nr:DUF3817 domain-containing protein [Leucobacter weissii]
MFRSFATAEAVTWAGLITALVLRAADVTDSAVPLAGGLHGFVFLAYCVVTVFVWVNQRWRWPVGAIGLLLAVIPFATVPFEIVLARRRLLEGRWRLRPGGENPEGFPEAVQAWVLRRPRTAVLLLVALVAVVFLVLLWLGPPVQKS